MYSDDQIRTVVREIFVKGEQISIRKVRSLLGGGSPNRISAIIKELNLPQHQEKKDNHIPLYLLEALERFMDENRTLGKTMNFQTIEEMQHRIDYLEAQVAALTDALTERRKVNMETKSLVLKAVKKINRQSSIHVDGENINEIDKKQEIDGTELQNEILKEYRDIINQNKYDVGKHPEKSIKRRNRGIMIDGLKGYQIANAHVDTLTPAQREWRKEYEKIRSEKKKLKNCKTI